MTTPDLLIKKIENQKTSKKEKISLLEEFKQELKKYVSGDLKEFKNTAIYGCFKHHYNFYLRKLSSQPPQSHSSQQRQSNHRNKSSY